MVVNYLSTLRGFGGRIEDEQYKEYGLQVRPHTRLYYQSPSEAPKNILIQGNGLSSVWVKKHFPNANITVITDSRDATLPRVPSNKTVNYDEIKLVYFPDLGISDDKKSIQIPQESGGHVINIEKEYFTATGVRPYTELTQCFSANHLITNEIPRGLFFTGPKNIPTGSLTHHLMMFYLRSEMYDDTQQCFEMQYYIDNVLPSVINDKMRENQIDLSILFFDTLELRIKSLEKTLPSDKELAL